LALDAVQVGAGGCPGPHIAQGGGAVHHLAARFDVQAGLGVFHRFFRAQLYPAHGVDDVDETRESDLHVVVDPHPAGLFEGAHQGGGAAAERLRVGGVDLVGSDAGDLHVRVAGHADDGGPAFGGHVEHHDRVGALPLGFAGPQRLHVLVAEAFSAVGSDDEVGGARLVVGAALVGDQGCHAVQAG